MERITENKLEATEIKVELTKYDVQNAAKNLADLYFKRIGFWNVDVEAYYDYRFINNVVDNKFVVEFSREFLTNKSTKHGGVAIKAKRDIDGLFYMETGNLYRIFNKWVEFTGTIDELVDEILKRYDNYLDYPEFSADDWKEYLADHGTAIKQVKGRIVRLSYKPVSCWEGDEMRGDDNIRCSVSDGTVTKYNFYNKDVDDNAEKKLIKDVVETSGLFREISKDRLTINLNKLEKYLVKNSNKFIQQELNAIKTHNDSKYNSLNKKLDEMQKIGFLSTSNSYIYDSVRKELSYYTFDYGNYKMYSKYHNTFEKFARQALKNELVDKYNEVLSKITIFEIPIESRRYTINFYLQIPTKLLDDDKVNKILVKPDTSDVGMFIGKGGANIKQVSSELGKRIVLLIIDNNQLNNHSSHVVKL